MISLAKDVEVKLKSFRIREKKIIKQIHFQPNIVSGCTGKTNIRLEFMPPLSSEEQTAWWNSYPVSTVFPCPNANHRQVTEEGIRAVLCMPVRNRQNCIQENCLPSSALNY